MGLPVVGQGQQWDPRAEGAKCDRCSLGPRSLFVSDPETGDRPPWHPVRPTRRRGAFALVVGEAPGREEVERDEYFVGVSGKELDRALYSAGLDRGAVSLENRAACRPPGNEWERHKMAVAKHNSLERARQRDEPDYKPDLWLTPDVACQPRLMAHARHYKNLILLGGTALGGWFSSEGVLSRRGRPYELCLLKDGRIVPEMFASPSAIVHRWKVMASVHPAHAMRQQRWRPILRNDLKRAKRFFMNKLKWAAPTLVRNPRPHQVRSFVQGFRGRRLGLDIETRINPDIGVFASLHDVLRCIGLGDRQTVFMLGFVSVDGFSRGYTDAEEAELWDIILDEAWESDEVLVTGWNLMYEQLVLEREPHLASALRRRGEQRRPRLRYFRDPILDHHVNDPEFPHSLGAAASTRIDAPAWKDGDTATEARNDTELHVYCSVDVGNSEELCEILTNETEQKNLVRVVAIDHAKQQMCADLQRIGMRINQAKRAEKERLCAIAEVKWTEQARELVGRPMFNPHSTDQVSDLLYYKWKLPIFSFSDKTGEPSTEDGALVALYALRETDNLQKETIRSIRHARKERKRLGTFLRPLRPRAEGGHVDSDGRIRSNFLAHVVVSGRLSSSKPVNLQTLPVVLRDCFEPEEGNVYVMIDKDQLELRIAAAKSQSQFYLQCFREKKDPHGTLAELTWGDKYRNAAGDKKTGPKGRLRTVAKQEQYAALYGAGISTIHELVTSAEDENEELIFARIKPQETSALYDNWLKLAPEFPRWWEYEMESWQRLGYVASAILGRQIPCADDVEGDRSKITNSAVQSSASDAVDSETMEVLDAYPLEWDGAYTGLVHQGHDSLVMECRANRAEETAERMTQMMTKAYAALPGVVLTAEAAIATHWS